MKNLEKKDIDLIVCDLDDTIFSTKELLKRDYRKWRRWHEWNIFLLENNLIDKAINEVYKNKKYPQIIASKLRKNHDLILTAWLEEFQIKKIKATKLEHINMIIVESAEEKPLRLIEYIENTLWFIPNKIVVYEDRPNFFIKQKDFIENTLWTKLEIMFVEMKDNETEPKITKL